MSIWSIGVYILIFALSVLWRCFVLNRMFLPHLKKCSIFLCPNDFDLCHFARVHLYKAFIARTCDWYLSWTIVYVWLSFCCVQTYKLRQAKKREDIKSYITAIVCTSFKAVQKKSLEWFIILFLHIIYSFTYMYKHFVYIHVHLWVNVLVICLFSHFSISFD